MSDSISSVLQTSAEISVAFVGFASLVGVFYARTDGALPDRIRVTLRSLLDYGLLALLGCGLPLLLEESSVASTAIWRFSSAIMAAALVAYLGISHVYYKEVAEISRAADRSTAFVFLLVGDAIAIVILLLNAVSWPFNSLGAVYLAAAVFWNVCGAALSFRAVIDLAWSD